MKIIIDYESSWRNSFLDGSNNEPLPKKGRNFVASMTELKKEENFKPRQITKDTVLGVLNRLIGDQRKLYQSRSCYKDEAHYFSDIEVVISFEDRTRTINQDMTYIRNMNGNTDQNSFTGMIKASDPMLQSDFSTELWGVLFLNINEVCQFITDKEFRVDKQVVIDPVKVVDRAILLNDLKPVESNSVFEEVVSSLNSLFPDMVSEKQPAPYVENNGKIKPIRLYSAALYIQLDRLSSKYDMKFATTKAGKIAGFSKRGFNGKRDFMKNFVTGGEKLIWGGAYIREEYQKGEGKIKHLLTKASGQLTIHLNIDLDKAIELKTMIDNAGVSAFYLGKKGLAYVSHIDVR